MEGYAFLVVLAVVVTVFVLPVVAFARAGRAEREAERINRRLTAIEVELVRLRNLLEKQAVALEGPVERTVVASEPRSEQHPAAPLSGSAPLEGLQRPPDIPGSASVPGTQPIAPLSGLRPVLPTARMSAELAPAVPPIIPPISVRQPAFGF